MYICMVWEKWFLNTYKSACKIAPKAGTGKICCLELVFLKTLMLFDRQQGEYVLTPKKGLATFYFCELHFYRFFFPTHFAVFCTH